MVSLNLLNKNNYFNILVRYVIVNTEPVLNVINLTVIINITQNVQEEERYTWNKLKNTNLFYIAKTIPL